MRCYFLILTVLIFQNIKAQQSIITVKLSGFDSNKGKAMIMLLDEEEKELEKHILPINNKEASFQFSPIKAGYFAIKAFHDANSNGKLDTNLLGIPKEKWGVSNNVKASFGPPDFKKMLFEVKKDLVINIELR